VSEGHRQAVQIEFSLSNGIFDTLDGADTLDEVVRSFRKDDTEVALLAFARMIADAEPDDRDDLRTCFLEACVIGHHGQIE
jgi:hypothetical protein